MRSTSHKGHDGRFTGTLIGHLLDGSHLKGKWKIIEDDENGTLKKVIP
ncbi:hypothetical protein [Dialister sp.]